MASSTNDMPRLQMSARTSYPSLPDWSLIRSGWCVCVCVCEGRAETGHLLYVCVGSQICSKWTNSYPTEPCCPGNGFDSKFITILSSSENWTSNTTYQEYSRPMNMVCFKSLKNIHNQVWLGLKWRSNTTTSINMSFVPGIELNRLRTGLVQLMLGWGGGSLLLPPLQAWERGWGWGWWGWGWVCN